MDFLDPRKRRSYQIRLIVGYVLMAIAISLGTIILVYGAYGYGINTKNGDIIQNGLLFVGSKPGAAQIYLNHTLEQSTTPARLVLPAGTYNLTIKKAGYRDWTRKFVLDEHSIARFVYPFLFPDKPQISSLKTYSSQPPLMTESPDQKWLLLQTPADTSSPISFDEYDTTSLTKAPQSLVLPDAVLTKGDTPDTSLAVVEWSSDNNHLLLQHSFSGGSEYILFDRNKPEASVNLSKLFKVSTAQLALYDKKAAQVYVYDQASGTLALGDIATGVIDSPLLSHVLAFKPYGPDFITYVTDQKASAGEALVRIWNNGQTYDLYTVTSGDKYLVDAAAYQGHTYFVAGSNKDSRVNVYRDPLNDIKDPSQGKAIPVLSLNELGAGKVSFSNNARFVAAENGQQISVYDTETLTNYGYTLQPVLAGPLVWMDGHRLIGQSGGNIFVSDFDGTNQQLLGETTDIEGGLFSADYNHLFTLAQSAGGVVLENIDLRAGTDLPKTASQ